MDSSTQKARNAFVDRMGQLGSELGLNPAIGSIYSLLYMSAEPISLDEICEACGMSKGNASMNLRELERWGAANRIPVRGDRRSFYEANLDIVGIIRGQLREGLERRLQEADRALEGVEGAFLRNGDTNTMKVMKERLAKVREMEATLRTLISTFL